MFRNVKAEEVNCRVQSINDYKTTLLLYIDARTAQNILDEEVGVMNWERKHSGASCTVSIWDEGKKMWVSKEDTGAESNTEAEKGLASDSFKRACVNWGIGRELYTTPLIQIPTKYIAVKDYNGRKTTFDKFEVDKIVIEDKQIMILTVSIVHNDKREWVWSYKRGEGVRTHNPSWVQE